MTEDVDKAFFDVLVELKEIDPEAYYKILEKLGYDSVDDEKQHIFLVERSKKNFNNKIKIDRKK